ncbi:unnamed protein product [Brassicogethes aeneus]|uniref:Putative inorganic phosphate cotransporter n=1 Tax=Brassicogethes aeneus TaxID=1431903 RepID=A0A9P0BDP5_BRAAE|nr:unnamed protein product [Brassicogethes aeneus]
MSDSEKCETELVSKPVKRLGVRHVQYVLLFLATVIGYGMRTNLSEGIVAITATDKDKPSPDIKTYPEWKDYKNTMLSSFFWGYVCLQIGAGQIAKKFGPKLSLTLAIAVSSSFSILLPILADVIGYQGVIICRVFQGLSQGFLYPSFHHLLSVWAPNSERSKVISFVYTGGPLGNVISLQLTGFIADSTLGWPVVFYIYGGLGLTWSVVYFIYGSNSPSQIKNISESEKKFIESETCGESKNIPTPWKAIFTSSPLLAITIGHAGNNWGFWTLLTEIPSYLKSIFDYKLKTVALLDALAYFAMWTLGFVFSPIADHFITKKVFSIGATRKIMNSIGLFIPAAALVALAFLPKEQGTLAIVLLVVAVGINSATFCGYNVNHIDISPNHAGVLMGITNSVSNVCSILAPLAIDGIRAMTGYDEEDKALWTIVFCLSSGIYVVSGLYFNIFASGEIQPWNSEDYLSKKKEQKESNS